MQQVADVAKEELARYFLHLAGRVERAVRSLPQEKFWVKPYACGNSVGHLVLHITGSLSHHIGGRFAATGYVRDPAAEFSDVSEEPLEAVQRRREGIQPRGSVGFRFAGATAGATVCCCLNHAIRSDARV